MTLPQIRFRMIRDNFNRDTLAERLPTLLKACPAVAANNHNFIVYCPSINPPRDAAPLSLQSPGLRSQKLHESFSARSSSGNGPFAGVEVHVNTGVDGQDNGSGVGSGLLYIEKWETLGKPYCERVNSARPVSCQGGSYDDQTLQR